MLAAREDFPLAKKLWLGYRAIIDKSEVVSKIVDHVKEQGASQRKSAVRHSALADEHFGAVGKAAIERYIHF